MADRLSDPDRLASVRASRLVGLDADALAPFERLVRLATDQLAIPQACVSVLDADVQYDVAVHGLLRSALPARAGITHRVIELERSVVVPDSRYEPGYGRDSLPARLGVISYAGVPFRDPRGMVIGALSGMVPRARVWTAAETDLLEELAEIGTAELALRATAAHADRVQRRMGAVVESALDAILTMDAAGRITEFNPAAERMFGHARDAAVGANLAGLIIPERFRARHEASRRRNHATQESHILDRRLELAALHADGSEFPVELTVTRTDLGDDVAYTGFIRDLTDRRRAERALRDAQSHLALTIESAPLMVYAVDADGTITLAQGSARSGLGHSAAALRGHNAFELYADEPWVLRNLERCLGGEVVDDTVRVGARWFESHYRPLTEDGVVVGLTGVSVDVTDRLAEEAGVAQLAYTDALSGLPNRAWLEESVAERIATGEPAALLFVDLDEFQAVNDSLGHAAGDAVLRDAALRLRATLGAGGLLARQGADEFLLFTPGDAATAERSAREVIAALEAPFAIDGLEFHIEASVGISLYPEHGTDIRELLRGAESALHRAKREPARRVAIHEPDPDAARGRLTMTARLRRALAEERFVLHYQPIFALDDGAISGVEALLRWEDPELGSVPPGDFIPIAEATGLIAPIGAWVAEAACRQGVAWAELGLEVVVGFNVSPVQLEREDFAGDLERILTRTGADPERLVVEITESLAMGAEGRHFDQLGRLTRLGIPVVIDDFGAGHSSLSRLRQLDVASLKIDRLLLEGVPADPGANAVLSASLAMADALGLPTVAEGVETEAQRSFLRERGCRWGQGFGLARPADAAATTELLIAGRAPARRHAALTRG